MILLGAHWERDPYFAPLAAILKGTSPFDEDDRIEEAQAWLTDYLPAARGDGACHFKAGFQGLIDLALPDDQIANYALPLGMDLEAALLGLVEQMYPSMLAWHGPEPTRDRLRILLHSASRYYGVSGTWHLTYYAMLGMTCGVGQDQDEVLPWIRRSLARIQTLGPEQAIVRLSRRARTWFEHVLDDWPAKTSPDDEAKEA